MGPASVRERRSILRQNAAAPASAAARRFRSYFGNLHACVTASTIQVRAAQALQSCTVGGLRARLGTVD